MKNRISNHLNTVGLLIAITFATPSHAVSILFTYVNTYSNSYYSNGQAIAGYLSSAGHTVTQVDLRTTLLGDISSYDQVWVYDLSYQYNDNTATHLSNYNTIANWFDSSSHDLIVDGRIISSHYANSISGGVTRQEPAWIQNYALQLALRSGGLVLGTDHNIFNSGINTINNLIGIDGFTGYFFAPPYEATVDTSSPLYVSAGTHDCSTSSNQCIWDHSSTSFVPTGQQNDPNIYLTPVAYHGDISPGDFSNAYNQAAVASTLGSRTFGTCGGPNQPPCTVPEPSILLLMASGLAVFGIARRQTRT